MAQPMDSSNQPNQPSALTSMPQGGKRFTGFLVRLGVLFALLALAVASMIVMPGKSYAGPEIQPSLDELHTAANLRKDVTYLAGTIGERNFDRYPSLEKAVRYIEGSFESLGYTPQEHEFVAEGFEVKNISVEVHGAWLAPEIIVVGAHYDSVGGCPGADDHGSGVAALLEMARQLELVGPARTIRLVAFVNEEPPNFQTRTMGSWVYAKRSHELNGKIVAAISLETLGMYSDTENSQRYPAALSLLSFPQRGILSPLLVIFLHARWSATPSETFVRTLCFLPKESQRRAA